MTNTAVHPSAPTPYPPPPKSSGGKDVPLWWILVAVVVMLAMGAGAYVLYVGEFGKKPDPGYPARWDARIEPYAKIAERQRGLYFLHPVAVRFLEPKAFEKTVTTEQKDLSKKDREELAQFAGQMRALGLISGGVDLVKALNAAQGASTLAYYSFDDQRITIRGRSLPPAARSTLVHELTHALQDQRFGVGRRLKTLQKAGEDAQVSVLEAVVEGDASRVEAKYRDSLSARARKALDAGRRREGATASSRTAKVPKIVTSLLSAPYLLGEGLTTVVSEQDGNSGVDRLLKKTPKHESVLIDPFTALTGTTSATKVSTPKVGDGEKKLDSGEFGAVTWYLMLAQRIPLAQALTAVDGWSGDRYVSYRTQVDCIRATYAGRTTADAARMSTALRQWMAGAATTKASVSLQGRQVRFQSCDPGRAARVGADRSEQALSLVATRAAVGLGILRSKGTPELAQCVSRGMGRSFSVAQLSDPRFASKPDLVRRARAIGAGCR